MFGFGKKKKKHEQEPEATSGENKKKSRTDKLVMGAIVGVAVGSVVGMSLKGKNEHEQSEEKPKIQEPTFSEPAEPRSRLGRLFKRLFGKKKKKKPAHHGASFKKIPNEWE